MPDRSMQGVYPILSMPFDAQGRIVFEDLRNEVDWAIGHGVPGLGIAVASEVYKLTEAERDEVTKAVVDQSNGRAKIVINTGEQGTDLAVHYSKRAEELGADALMIRPPTFIPVPESEVIEYFRRIAEAVSIPIFQQDQATAQIGPALAEKLARTHENLCYIKVETPPTLPRMAQTAEARGDSGLILFGGAGGSFFLEELDRGAVGCMPGCTLPDAFVRVWDLWQAGKHAEAQAEFSRLEPIIRTLSQALGLANWIYKDILVYRGVFQKTSAFARHPSLEPDDMARAEVIRLLESAGIAPGE
ncbi:MAG: dihydrodipicolinate synthase family protein [Chloroflexi bacterium]|nr:dihydrodipicolinate synthase family protein [Chloroflexota bacterium]